MRTRAELEQTIEDAIEANNEDNLNRYLFEILLDIREWHVPHNPGSGPT